MFSSTDEDTADPIVPAGLHLASIGRRIAGLVIDQLVITVPVFAAFYFAGYAPREALTDGRAVWFTVVITSLALLYETIDIWRWGATVGKLLAGTRVVSVVDGGRLDLARSFQRSLVPATFNGIPQIGPLLAVGVYVWAFFDPLRQGVHDKAAGSIVVRGGRVEASNARD